MVIKGNLENSTERVTDQELRNRFKHIEKEIAEVGGVNKNDDKIEIAQGVLNGQFAEFLLKNENKEAFYRLKQDVSKMKNDWNFGNKAGPQLKKLYDFLDDISDEKKMEKDYDEFMEKIQNPKKLNTLKSWEVRRLNLYLGIHEDKALAAYNAMKPIFGKYAENKMEQEDISFFESVWNTLKANYSVSDNFMKEDYPAIEKLQPTSDSLKSLAGENWDGKNESVNIPDAENSIVDKSKVKEKVDGINNQRIESNREIVKNITITVDDLCNFTKKDGVLKYEGVEFSVDKMMLLFGNKIKESAGEVASFVNEAERDDMVDDCKNDIFSKLKNDLLDNGGVREENPDEDEEGGENTEEPKFRTYEEGKENLKIKMSALKDRIKELEFYDGNEDGEKVKFDIEKVKVYLEGLKDKSWNELERPSDPVDKGLWTIAVQIVLNYLATRDENSDYNVHYIDGIRGNETLKGVKAFQEANGLKFKNNQPDGLPGKVTIAKLLEVLGGEAIEDTSDSGTDGSEVVIEDDTNAGDDSKS